MYISVDVLVRLALIGLIVAGIVALVYLALVFKNLIATLKATTETLDLLQQDLEKLESPLDTVEQVSKTVSELQGAAKNTALSALTNLQAKIEGRSGSRKSTAEPKSKAQENTVPHPAADFQVIEPAEAVTEVIVEPSQPESGGKEND